MTKAKTKQRLNKVKLYCEPQTRAFLAKKWLNVDSSFEARAVLPKLLAQLGVSGNATAFLKRKENIACFSLSTDEILQIKFFDNREPLSTSECIIPNYETPYSRSFAITEMDGSRLYFYHLANNELTPCFMKTTYENNIVCTEVTRGKPTIRVSFEASKLFGCSLLLTIVIKNNRSSINTIEASTKSILNIINSDNGKNVYMYYEMLSNLLNHVVADYTVSFIGATGNITDEIVVENNICERFTVTKNNATTITVFRNHDWIYRSEYLNVQRIGEKFSFSSNLSEFQIDQLENITTVDHEIRKFISDNMWFAFEKVGGNK